MNGLLLVAIPPVAIPHARRLLLHSGFEGWLPAAGRRAPMIDCSMQWDIFRSHDSLFVVTGDNFRFGDIRWATCYRGEGDFFDPKFPEVCSSTDARTNRRKVGFTITHAWDWAASEAEVRRD